MQVKGTEINGGNKVGTTDYQNKLKNQSTLYSAIAKNNVINSMNSTQTPATTYTAPQTSVDSSPSYNAILDAYKSQLAQARDSYLAEIEARFNANKKAYEDQMEQAKLQYQSNRNASEVNRYKAKRAIRESLANRGQLDSGFGRQEALDMNLSYDNALNNINNQETSTLNQIKNYLLQLEADAKKEKANTEANYSNTLLSLANL